MFKEENKQMAMDKNELNALVTKVPQITKSEELHPYQRLIFLYFQLEERKKQLWRFFVQAQTAVKFAEQDDQTANETAANNIREASAMMKALKWEIAGLNEQIKTHIAVYGDLPEDIKEREGLSAPQESNLYNLIETEDTASDEPEEQAAPVE